MDAWVRGLNAKGVRLIHLLSAVARGMAHIVPSRGSAELHRRKDAGARHDINYPLAI